MDKSTDSNSVSNSNSVSDPASQNGNASERERSTALNQQPANQPQGPNQDLTINSPSPDDLDYEMIPVDEVGNEHQRSDR